MRTFYAKEKSKVAKSREETALSWQMRENILTYFQS